MRKVRITIPETLNDIKLSQYQKFLRVTKDVEDESLVHRRMVAVFCNLTDTIVNNMSKQSFDSVLASLVSVLNFDDDIELKRLIMYQGREYGFIPNMDDMTVGEIADLDNYIVDWQKMDKAMGVLFRPTTNLINDKYLIKEYKTNVSLDLPLGVVLGAYFFLTNLLKDLLSYIPNSIMEVVEQDPKSRALVENGVGLNQFTDSLNALCLDMRLMLQK